MLSASLNKTFPSFLLIYVKIPNEQNMYWKKPKQHHWLTIGKESNVVVCLFDCLLFLLLFLFCFFLCFFLGGLVCLLLVIMIFKIFIMIFFSFQIIFNKKNK